MSALQSCILFVCGVLCIATSLICVKPKPFDPKKVATTHFDAAIQCMTGWGDSTDFWVYAPGQEITVTGAATLSIKTEWGTSNYRAEPDASGKMKWVNVDSEVFEQKHNDIEAHDNKFTP